MKPSNSEKNTETPKQAPSSTASSIASAETTPRLSSTKHKGLLDDLLAPIYVAGIFEDERPPKGLAGLLDWRMHGYLSKRMKAGEIIGHFGELVLMPCQMGQLQKKFISVGLGKKSRFDLAAAKRIFPTLARSIAKLSSTDVALYLPIACDEKKKHQTQKLFWDKLEQESLQRSLLLHWVDDSTVEML